MLNAEDALGLQEDLSILGRGRHSPVPLPTSGAAERQRHEHIAILALRKDIDRLQEELRDSKDKRSDLAAVIRAFRQEWNDVLAQWAQETGRDFEELRAKSLARTSRRYDALVEQFKAQGSIQKDQRQDPALMKKRDWYVEP